jgi:hypothetical protein
MGAAEACIAWSEGANIADIGAVPTAEEAWPSAPVAKARQNPRNNAVFTDTDILIDQPPRSVNSKSAAKGLTAEGRAFFGRIGGVVQLFAQLWRQPT